MLSVTQALERRTSVRAFLDTPVSEQAVREILEAARWAPSGGNLQPWRVIAIAGEERDAVIALAEGALKREPLGEPTDYPIYPPKLWEPYRTRRYALGEEMYALLGIPREDKLARLGRFAENFRFFGAPAALFFVTDDRFGHGQWAHLGMLMQSIALVATEHGLSTCMQEAWGAVRRSLGEHFGLGEHEMIYCAMALGYADPEAPVNRLRSERMRVDELATFRGFR